MPLKVGTTNAVRVYKRQYVEVGMRPPGEDYIPYDFDPSGYACVIGLVATYDGRYYTCQQVEVTHLKTATQDIHKRVTLTFNANGGSGGSSQTRTWGVENVTQPSSPTRSGYTLQGWATTSSASTPNVSFPFLAPQNNTTYYAVWKISTPQTVSPTLIDKTGIRDIYFMYSVQNDDASSATIYSDVSTNPPTTSRGLIASNAQTSTINTGSQKGIGITIYARAQASGKTMSSITSLYME